MNVSRTTKPRAHSHITATGQPVTYPNVPTTTYTGTSDAGEQLATITVIDPTGEITAATCLGSHLPGGGNYSLIGLVKAVAQERDLCIGEPDYDQPLLLNAIATHRDLVNSVDLMTDEGLDAENAAVLNAA